MTSVATRDDDVSSLSRHAWTGMIAIVGLVVGLVWWSSTVEIAGAVVAPGAVAVESYPKQIQHQEGGIVKAFYVRNGDVVDEGELLVALDDTVAAANLTLLRSRWRQSLLREARLLAEIAGDDDVVLPPVLADMASDPEVHGLLLTEQQIFRARAIAKTGRAAQLNEQIVQLRAQIAGLDLQRAAVEQQLEISMEETANLEALRRDQLVEASRVTALGKQHAQLEGQLGEILSTTGSARAAIAERTLQITQLDDDSLTYTLDELQETRQALSEAAEQLRATQDRLERTQIKSPQRGVVHESKVHTVGGVVSPGEILMTIIPQGEAMLISVQINPSDVDRIKPGQEALLRLSNFDPRATPELTAIVQTVSPDVTQDTATGAVFYSARLSIPEDELAKLPASNILMPGMPVEAFIETDERTVLSYLLKPFTDELQRAFREE
jgi:HlyD family secretion protein